jgi:hypothetical protein
MGIGGHGGSNDHATMIGLVTDDYERPHLIPRFVWPTL